MRALTDEDELIEKLKKRKKDKESEAERAIGWVNALSWAISELEGDTAD